MKRILVILADGFEEMEGVIVIDVLRRAGFDVVSAGLHDGAILASRNTRHLADRNLDDVLTETFDMIVLPGGAPGAKALSSDARVRSLLDSFHKNGGLIGAICAAPNVLRSLGIIHGEVPFTMHPGPYPEEKGGHYTKDRLVRYKTITTSIGPGSAFEFALDLVEQLGGRELKEKISAPMHLP